MSGKLYGNGLWEGSRMVLPEHREAILKYQLNHQKKQKPVLHEDEWEIINQNILYSKENGKYVTVEIYGEIDNQQVHGIVTYVDVFTKRVKIEYEDGYEWIDFNEILKVVAE